MYRVRITLPKNKAASYTYLDLLHDAVVNGWVAAGADPQAILGPAARMWHFGALGGRTPKGNYVHTLVIGTADAQLAGILPNLQPKEIKQVRALTDEAVDFSNAVMETDLAPVAPGQQHMGVLMLSPLAISVPKASRNEHKWHQKLTDLDVGAAVSARLSRLSRREVQIRVWPDTLYLRSYQRHDVLVRVKKNANGREGFVIGMKSPLVLEGSENDLKLAWYAGIGEKNRNGFGCIGAVDKGVGR